MFTFVTIIIALLLGYNVGVKHERNKYLLVEDEESEIDSVVASKKESKIKALGKSIKRNVF